MIERRIHVSKLKSLSGLRPGSFILRWLEGSSSGARCRNPCSGPVTLCMAVKHERGCETYDDALSVSPQLALHCTQVWLVTKLCGRIFCGSLAGVPFWQLGCWPGRFLLAGIAPLLPRSASSRHCNLAMVGYDFLGFALWLRGVETDVTVSGFGSLCGVRSRVEVRVLPGSRQIY